MMKVLYYTSADSPDLSGYATWSVYVEQVDEAGEPVDGTQEHVSTHPNEDAADKEAKRLQGRGDLIYVPLTLGELGTLIGALGDSEYWDAGDNLPRNNGCVFIPGDYVDTFPGREDVYWPEPPTEDEQESIEQVLELRAMAKKLGTAAQALQEWMRDD